MFSRVEWSGKSAMNIEAYTSEYDNLAYDVFGEMGCTRGRHHHRALLGALDRMRIVSGY